MNVLLAPHLAAHAPSPDGLAPGARFDCGASPGPRSALREAIAHAHRRPEAQALAPLLARARSSEAARAATDALARRLVNGLRTGPRPTGHSARVQNLMQEYALSSEEGVALMCLAEALLRIPDAATRDALIRDKIGRGDWRQHLGHSPSLFVNAASWGLLLSGKLVATHSEGQLLGALTRRLVKGSEPLIRQGMQLAMQMLGEQFVTGETIAEALQRARDMQARGFRYSYDMLGEAALTAADAQRYFEAYEQAIHAIGQSAAGQGVCAGPGISIKLSALHPRYSRAQQQRVLGELLPRVHRLAALARRYDIGLNIDAEEAERLDLSLDLLEALCASPELQGWQGLGFVVQAYQKRAPFVIDFLLDLARRSGLRLMVRLVKGAYWDSEIKRAQQDGQSDYPVYTRKHHTDVSYLACARQLLDAGDALYPQFATHNAHTLAAIVHMAHELRGDFVPGQYEFQCLHGMGEALYLQVVNPWADSPRASPQGEALWQRPCRIYAPVGTHETLLAYLVRRLLENGANSAFVHRLADPHISLDELVQDPVQRTEQEAAHGVPGQPHRHIPLPAQLYGVARRNAAGLDLTHEPTLRQLAQQMAQHTAVLSLHPLIAGLPGGGAVHPLRNPADHSDLIGQVQHASLADVDSALQAAQAFAPVWAQTDPAQRAALLEQAADLLQADAPHCLALLVREAGKTWAHAVAEWREAVDFLRYYAAQVRRDFTPATHVPLGPVLCISPWNFPLAIFMGQVAAALAAGNPVLAKPAEQTPAVAALAVRTLWRAGVPPAAVQLLPGSGHEVGMALARDARVQGVLFTGSTSTAKLLKTTLAERLNGHAQEVPLIAETGGQNAMVVDSSALLEQVAQDAVASAFEAAGQRCSALRVLCVQEEVADRLLALLQGAMAELRMGMPAQLHTDVGPVIDTRAQATIEAHVARMQAAGRRVHRLTVYDSAAPAGTRVAPTLIEIERLDEWQHEVFGPVLHVLRWRRQDLADLISQINSSGYALTLGVHSRIDETITQVTQRSHAGNVYVNRNIVGAVVGVQPFGGEGLSGTGPKAGGPLYLLRLLARCPDDAALRSLQACGAAALPQASAPLQALHDWAVAQGRLALAHHCARLAACNPAGLDAVLPGPTGEHNVYQVRARAQVLCHVGTHAGAQDDLLLQIAAVLAVGGQPVLSPHDAALHGCLPPTVQAAVRLPQEQEAVVAQAALVHAHANEVLALARQLANRPGPIISLSACLPGQRCIPLERLLSERSISTNTAAAGGNASLMVLH
ncbi:MAG: trifunctional transcriptional regulator/proline dehydrogenase/L-glutamate gamma-semialdehyde dehydrogenase, partial [Betaproteobacteria bacterium]|nr:trifunctional transcriptional regulator/proline dehydrogenase/L-glutamate gamma-semialdehyde dehydrogenase [Betaproteobacteria bacterium]